MRRRLVAIAVGAALLTGTANAATPVIEFSLAPRAPSAIPSAEVPNSSSSLRLPEAFTTPPAYRQQVSFPALQGLWQRAGAAYGIPWQVLASINRIESNFGQNMGPSSAGAVGWMQFMPSTWLRWGLDADGDGIADPWNPVDAIYAAARYLAAAGGRSDLYRGVFAYNHAHWYVREVLDLARVYGGGGLSQTTDLQHLQVALDTARQQVISANEVLIAAKNREQQLREAVARLYADAESVALLSDRLAAQRRAALLGIRVQEAHQVSEAAAARLEQAHTVLEQAHQQAMTPSFSPGVGSLMGAPSYQGGYVFPVGGGPQTVSVGHDHHDYAAADIAAPMGAPVYALTDGVVESAWHTSAGACGIGLRFRSDDGLLWVYCHLSYLQPSVEDGVRLSAGMQIGLVGSTGHSTGPHLHLGLKPSRYPQEMPWFQGFAGRAFRWQDAPTPLEPVADAPLATRTFAVVPETRDPVIGFTSGRA